MRAISKKGEIFLAQSTLINNNEKGKAGHAWIVDGISRRTRYLRLRIYEQMIVDQKLFDVFYHFNWGWAGKCNGFFFSDSYQFVVDNAIVKIKTKSHMSVT